MKVIRKSCIRGAEEARGTTVVIDVFRAFTCEPLFFHFGARRVVLETDPARAKDMRERHPDWILAGEHNEIPIPGADLGNSPSEIVLRGRDFFLDKTVIHRTTAGVTGVVAALGKAGEVLLGSFLIAGATARYILRRKPEVVTLVSMGERALRMAPEDEACAEYLDHLLTGAPFDPVEALKGILFQPTAQKFIQGRKPHLPREDPSFCLQRDLLDFALRAEREEDRIVVRQVK
ncbi:MAG: 2-phosphosulfolactate phosphatase [Deltaproteobacteria bacterium]|nr:2-phosphosulfolactate phosphatase [Deltaproteobacteria bacterium]